METLATTRKALVLRDDHVIWIGANTTKTHLVGLSGVPFNFIERPITDDRLDLIRRTALSGKQRATAPQSAGLVSGRQHCDPDPDRREITGAPDAERPAGPS